MLNTPENVGAFVNTVNPAATVPAAVAAGTRNSAYIDKLTLGESCVLALLLGATTGAPASFTADLKIQDADDSGGTNVADYKPDGVNVAKIVQAVAASARSEADVNLRNARRWIRLVEVVAFTGGTTPTIGAASLLVAGGARNEPV